MYVFVYNIHRENIVLSSFLKRLLSLIMSCFEFITIYLYGVPIIYLHLHICPILYFPKKYLRKLFPEMTFIDEISNVFLHIPILYIYIICFIFAN